MPRATVQKILQSIEQLPEEDRLELEQELAARFEQEWQAEAAKARHDARTRGIDQAAIDAMIERRRYESNGDVLW
jgi:hypothetical protein